MLTQNGSELCKTVASFEHFEQNFEQTGKQGSKQGCTFWKHNCCSVQLLGVRPSAGIQRVLRVGKVEPPRTRCGFCSRRGRRRARVYGLTRFGAVLTAPRELRESTTIFISSWLMSCKIYWSFLHFASESFSNEPFHIYVFFSGRVWIQTILVLPTIRFDIKEKSMVKTCIKQNPTSIFGCVFRSKIAENASWCCHEYKVASVPFAWE